MSRFRTILCWLLCALLVGAGAPSARASCTAGTAGGTGGCCSAKAKCCCPETAQGSCGCRTPKRPAPPPLPKQPLLCNALEPVREPATAIVPPQPRVLKATQVDLPTGAVPHRSRQEALSVWRC